MSAHDWRVAAVDWQERALIAEQSARDAMDDLALTQQDLAGERHYLARERERTSTLTETLRAIQANAEAWHGPSSQDNRHEAALAVIARWARDPSSIPDGVRQAARNALAAEKQP